MEKFKDRKQAGQMLAAELTYYKDKKNVFVLALPRGGVPVAFEIAKSLHLPLDLLLVRKLGVPDHEELAFGAITVENDIFLNKNILAEFPIAQTTIDQIIKKENKELMRRNLLYRQNKKLPNLKEKIILLIDDGIATGATVRAAVDTLKKKQPAKIIIVTPVMAKSTYEELNPIVDEIICPCLPSNFFAVGAWYETFNQTSDDEVCHLISPGT